MNFLQKSKKYREYLLEILKIRIFHKIERLKYVAFCIHPGVYKYIKKNEREIIYNMLFKYSNTCI